MRAATTPQSGATPEPARTSSAAALVMVMTTSEVPAAYRIGTPRARTRAGTTRKPPPTPRKPVSSPTTVAVTSTLSACGQLQMKVGLKVMIGSSRPGRRPSSVRVPRRSRTSMTPPTTSRSAAKAAMQHLFGHLGGGQRPHGRAADGDEAEGHAAGEEHEPCR